MINIGGIKFNFKKNNSIMNMISPQCIIDIQRLIGRVITLNKIISLIKEYFFPFFKTLKNIFNFKWTLEFKKVFKEKKESRLSSPNTSQPQDGGDIFIYLVVTD